MDASLDHPFCSAQRDFLLPNIHVVSFMCPLISPDISLQSPSHIPPPPSSSFSKWMPFLFEQKELCFFIVILSFSISGFCLTLWPNLNFQTKKGSISLLWLSTKDNLFYHRRTFPWKLYTCFQSFCSLKKCILTFIVCKDKCDPVNVKQ